MAGCIALAFFFLAASFTTSFRLAFLLDGRLFACGLPSFDIVGDGIRLRGLRSMIFWRATDILSTEDDDFLPPEMFGEEDDSSEEVIKLKSKLTPSR